MDEYFRRIRRSVGHELLLLPSTACVILNDHDEVLLCLRTDNGMWGCPGGIMDTGETVLENLRREVLEESGLEIFDPLLLGVYSGSDFEYTYPNGDETAVVQTVFVVRTYRGTPHADAESTELKFVPLRNLPSPITPPHVLFLQHCLEYVEGTRVLPVVL